MSEAPKKIWVECYEDEDDGELDLFFSAKGHGEEYIRADIVEEMREALEMFQAWMTDIHTYTLLEVDMKAETAPKDDPETDFGMMDEPIYLARRKGLDDFFTCSKDRYEELSVLDLFETKLAYLHPPTKTAPMKPMTEEEIDEELETNEYYCAGSFAEGVRYAERFHGITDVRE